MNLRSLLLLVVFLISASARADPLHDAARQEGRVSIYASTDLKQAAALVAGFEANYPGVKVEYNDLGSLGIFNRVIAEAAAQQVTGDIIWSSGMDLQMKLHAEGLFQKYRSTHYARLPSWASYEATVYGTSLEPACMIYNEKVFSRDELPKTQAGLIEFLRTDARVKGKVASLDPYKSGTGFVFHTHSAQRSPSFWQLVAAFATAGGKSYSSSGRLRESVVSGENVLAFNVIGSYAMDWAAASDTLGVAFFADANIAFARIMAITKGSPHPHAAKLFLNYTLSKEGQERLAARGLPSVRSDTESGLNAGSLGKVIGGKIVPIAIDEGPAEYLDPMKRVKFLRRWKSTLERGR